MKNNIDDFIKERETPYSKIKDIKINKDGTVSYTEIYNLKHPMCPIINVCSSSKMLVLNNSLTKKHFEILYVSVDIENEKN